ncbi:MAG: TolC family protein, partial [Myxococcota bacterium]|nr:TolC family protein [Myxococcota bacterium]
MTRAQLTLPIVGLLWASACYTPTVVAPLSVESVSPPADLESQASSSSSGELTAEEAVRLGLMRHPRLRAARVGVDVAKAAVEGAVRRQNPELRLSQWHMEDVADGRWATLDLSLRFRPERPGMNASRRAIGEQGVHQANAEVLDVSRELTREIRRLHARGVLSRERMKTAEREAELRQEGLQLMSARVAAGAATAVDLELARAALAEVRDEAAEFRVEMAGAQELLYTLIGEDGERVRLGGLPGGVSPKGPPSLPEARELESQALNHRPEILDASADLVRAQARLWQEGRRSWPWLRFAQVGYELE